MRFNNLPRPRRSAVRFVRGALLMLVVLGVLGMHGLAAHSLSAASHTAQTPPTVAMGSLDMEPSGPTALNERILAAGQHQVGSPGPGGGDDHMAMVGICVAVLTGLALALAMALGRSYRVCWRVSPRAWRREPPLRSRIPRPPTLAELSLLRC